MFEDQDQLIKQVESGVLQPVWRENLQPHRPFEDKTGQSCSNLTVHLLAEMVPRTKSCLGPHKRLDLALAVGIW